MDQIKNAGGIILSKADMHDIAIETRDVSKVFKKNNFTAVDKINLSVRKGEIFGFLGSNGAGKTTTIKMICGLIAPTKGSIFINGHNALQKRSVAMRQIGVVLEGSRNIYWALSAWRNLMYFGKLKGCFEKEIKERGERLLRELELWDRRNDIIKNFSRGMQQKVAIACALVADPPILILDEPTLGLDVEATQIVKLLLDRLARDYNKTIMITTHQLGVVQKNCDRVAIMHQGKIIADKGITEILFWGQDYYQIKIQGNFNSDFKKEFDGFTIAKNAEMTVLTGSISEKTKLYNVIDKIRDLELCLVSVSPVEPDLEEVFLKLIRNQKEMNKHADI